MLQFAHLFRQFFHRREFAVQHDIWYFETGAAQYFEDAVRSTAAFHLESGGGGVGYLEICSAASSRPEQGGLFVSR